MTTNVADVCSCRGLVGTNSHSARFPYIPLPHVYDVIKSDIKNFVASNNLPFRIITDKTTRHLT